MLYLFTFLFQTEGGEGGPPRSPVPVLPICKTLFLGRRKGRAYSSCGHILDGFFPVADPFFLYLARTECCLGRRLPVQAHVRTLVVVEVDGGLDCLAYLLDGGEGQTPQQFVLDGVVHALGHSVVLGIAALGHADADVVGLQQVRVGVAGVLDAAVGVVNEILGGLTVKALERHLQGLNGELGFQRLAHTPADNLLRVVVCHDGEVAEVVLARLGVEADDHVGDVAHPQLVGTQGDEHLYQVRVQRQVVVGVRRTDAALALAHLQIVLVYDVVEAVVAHRVLIAELLAVHTPEFAAANARITDTGAIDKLNDEGFLGKLAQRALAVLVVGLGGHTKQLTL